MLKLYDSLGSGNGYKVRLLLHQLGIRFERIVLDILKGESRTAAFLDKNPNGRIPAVAFEDGRVLWESNALLAYFAEDTIYLPADRFQRGQALQWMFFEQYSHEPYIATSRFIRHYQMDRPDAARRLAERKPGGEAALAVMERHLARQPFFVGGAYSIADIALYAYTHVAEEGGFPLAPYPAIRDWLARIEAQPGYVPMGDPW